jgi:hypothetical protein
MQAFVHHTPHRTQVIKIHKNIMAGTELVAVGLILLLSMGLANTPHQIYASKSLNQASKSSNSNTGKRGCSPTRQRGRSGRRRIGPAGDTGAEEERLSREGVEMEGSKIGDAGLGRKLGSGA